MNKKIIIFVTAMVLVLAMATGATFAYLFQAGNTVQNVFKPTYIGDPAVSETKTDFTVVPGVAIPKDPTVKYTRDTNSTRVATIVLYATIDVKGSTWSYASNKFTFTNSGNTLDFTVNTTNWQYIGKAASGKYVYSYVKVLSGSTDSAAFEVISGNVVNVSTGWTEDQIQSVFGAGGVQINVGSFVAQAKPTATGSANTAVSVANAKTIWNNCAGDAISS